MASEKLNHDVNKIILTQEESNIYILYLVNEMNEEDSFMLQFQSDLSNEEKELGWTKYYLGYADGSRGNYNCIESIDLSKKQMDIKLNSIGKSTFEYSTLSFNFNQILDDNILSFIKDRFSEEDVILNV